MKQKVQLIRPPSDLWYTSTQISKFISVPTGLCLLATSTRDNDTEVEVIDGLNSSLDELKVRIAGDVVGVTDLYSCHDTAMNLLKEARQKKATTVVGGPNVSHLATRILTNHPYVDYVVVGDGEEAFPMLVSGKKETEIPNLFYRSKSGEIKHTKTKNAPLTHFFDLENLDKISSLDSVPISTIRGCINAERSKRCSFCSLEHALVLMDPELVWEQIKRLHVKYGVNSFLDSSDTFVVGNYPERLLAAKPRDLGEVVISRVFATPDQITREKAELLQQLNVQCVFLGVESYNNEILRRIGKPYSTEDIERGVELLAEQGIELHIPFMYGLPGDTPETLETTYQYAQRLATEHPSVILLTSFGVPLAGSELFESLRTHESASLEYPGDLDRDDSFDYQALVRLQLKHFTGVTYDQCQAYLTQTKNLLSDGAVTSFDIND